MRLEVDYELGLNHKVLIHLNSRTFTFKYYRNIGKTHISHRFEYQQWVY